MTSDQINNPVTEFYDLIAWKESLKLITSTYHLCEKFPHTEKFGIVDQLKRAVTSICANIAEGFGRFHYPDRIHFYHQARGSLKEIQNFYLISKELNLISQDDLSSVWSQSKLCEKLINGLIRSCQNLKS